MYDPACKPAGSNTSFGTGVEPETPGPAVKNQLPGATPAHSKVFRSNVAPPPLQSGWAGGLVQTIGATIQHFDCNRIPHVDARGYCVGGRRHKRDGLSRGQPCEIFGRPRPWRFGCAEHSPSRVRVADEHERAKIYGRRVGAARRIANFDFSADLEIRAHGCGDGYRRVGASNRRSHQRLLRGIGSRCFAKKVA